MSNPDDARKDITVRRVLAELWNEFVGEAKKRHIKSTALALEEAIRQWLKRKS